MEAKPSYDNERMRYLLSYFQVSDNFFFLIRELKMVESYYLFWKKKYIKCFWKQNRVLYCGWCESSRKLNHSGLTKELSIRQCTEVFRKSFCNLKLKQTCLAFELSYGKLFLSNSEIAIHGGPKGRWLGNLAKNFLISGGKSTILLISLSNSKGKKWF